MIDSEIDFSDSADPEDYVGLGTPQPSPADAALALIDDAELRSHLAGLGLDDAGGEKLLTADDVATLLNVKSQRVWALSREGKIPTIRLGENTLRYRRSAILEWLAAIESSG